MSDLDDLVETGVGALVLAFGVVAGAAVYSSGSIGVVSTVFGRFAYALSATLLPSLSLSAWPNVVALVAGVAAAVEIDGPRATRVAGFVATYLFLSVVVHYAVGPA